MRSAHAKASSPSTSARGDAAQCYADPGLARELLGWEARLGIDAMCADVWRWRQFAEHLEPER